MEKEGILVVQSRAVGDLDGIEKREQEARLSELVQRAGR